jgi:hypothetical protein
VHEVQFSTYDGWHDGQGIRRVVFQESFVIPPCKYVGSVQVITANTDTDVCVERLLVNRMWIFICPQILIVNILDFISCELCFITKERKLGFVPY